MGTLVRVYCYCCYVQYYGRKSRCFDTYCNLYWCNFTDICRTGKCMGTDIDDDFLHPVCDNIIPFCYWGEMFTYLFMSLPMSVWSIVTWLKNARNSSDGTVEIRKITRKGAGVLVLCNVAVTIAFYILLKKLNTPNLIFSTISVVTSFFAASLTMLRSSYYALGYASNDIVLIILWILASIKDPGYIPVVVNFLIFFLNDMYGFICWKKRETAQC